MKYFKDNNGWMDFDDEMYLNNLLSKYFMKYKII